MNTDTISTLVNDAQRDGYASTNVSDNSGMVINVRVEATFSRTSLMFHYNIIFTSVKGIIVCHNVFEAQVKLSNLMN